MGNRGVGSSKVLVTVPRLQWIHHSLHIGGAVSLELTANVQLRQLCIDGSTRTCCLQ